MACKGAVTANMASNGRRSVGEQAYGFQPQNPLAVRVTLCARLGLQAAESAGVGGGQPGGRVRSEGAHAHLIDNQVLSRDGWPSVAGAPVKLRLVQHEGAAEHAADLAARRP